MNPWWRRPAADEKPEPARRKKARAKGEDEPKAEAAGDAAAPVVDEPPVSPALEAATEPASPARPNTGDTGDAGDASPAGDTGDGGDASHTGDTGDGGDTSRAGDTGDGGESAASAPPRRRRRRRRRSRRGGRGAAAQGQDEADRQGKAGKQGEAREDRKAQAADAPPRARRSGGPGRAAVLLDLGGLERSLDGGSPLDPEGLLARLDADLGKLVLRRVYADASDRALDRKALHGGGAEVVDVPSGAEVRGCSAAVRIVVDALELCYTKRGVDTVVLAATSVQMLPLVAKLQQNGVTVVGLGGPEGDPQVRAQCDRFIDLSG